MASGFKIADAFVQIHAEADATTFAEADRAANQVGDRVGKGMQDGAKGKDVGKRIGDDVDSSLSPRAAKSGSDSGDKLSKGMEQAMIRNSPMIAAAIAGGVLLGGPVLAAAAVGVMGILAGVVASQSPQVKAAFSTLWSGIKTDMQGQAAILAPTFEAIAGMLAQSFQRIAPSLHTALQAVAPLLLDLTQSVTGAVETIVPSLTRVVQSAGPIVSGLGSLIQGIASGLATVFDDISSHSGAAGTVLSALGSIIQSLFSVLGDLIAQGAELGAAILPPVAAALHLVADALHLIAPVLPGVVAGFLAFKGISALSGPLGTLSTKLQSVATNAEGMGSKLAGASATGVSRLAGALPAIGSVLALLTTAFEMDQQQVNDWAQALLKGGAAADTARQQMAAQASFIKQQTSGWTGFANDVLGLGNAYRAVGTEGDRAQQSARDLYNAMTPLEQKQQDVTIATNNLNSEVAKYGPNSWQALSASITLKDKQDALKTAQDQLMQATHGVTQAMLDEADQALAAADSGLAYRRAQAQSTQAAKDFAQAVRDHKSALNDNSQASLDYEQALLRQAEAAGKAAADTSGLTDKVELQKVSDQRVLQELYRLRDEYGVNFPASLQQTITKLEHSGAALDDVGNKKPTPVVSANTAPLSNAVLAANGQLTNLAGQRPTPTMGINTGPFNFGNAQVWNALAQAGAQYRAPTVGLNDWASGGIYAIRNALGSLYNRTVTVQTNYVSTFSSRAAATGGRVGEVVKRFDVGGKISGPGGPTDDLVPAVTLEGVPLRVSNDEWVIRGAASKKYGDAKMAAINAGVANVSVPGRGLASGGATGAGAGDGSGNTYNVTLNLPNVVTIADPDLPRALVVNMRMALLKLEREQR